MATSLNCVLEYTEVEGNPACDRCRYWLKSVTRSGYGWCKRYPPSIEGAMRNPRQTVHPVTLSDDWCGEYEPRVEVVRKEESKQ